MIFICWLLLLIFTITHAIDLDNNNNMKSIIPGTLDNHQKHPVQQIQWYRPKVNGFPGNYTNFANDIHQFQHSHKRVYFNACPYERINNSNQSSSDNFYFWTIRDSDKKILDTFNSTNCRYEWTAPLEADNLTVQMQFYQQNKEPLSQTLSTSFFVRDIWLVILGDSFASGESNPDIPYFENAHRKIKIQASWLDEQCGRSAYGSFAYLLYANLTQKYPKHGFLLTYVACSESSIANGLLSRLETGHHHQQAQVTSILNPILSAHQQQQNKKPDAIFLTIGANDIGFFDVVLNILIGVFSMDIGKLKLDLHFDELRRDLMKLNLNFQQNQIDSGSIFYFEYFDPLRNSSGEIDVDCGGLVLASRDDLIAADRFVLKPLNRLIRNISEEFGWNFVGNIAEEVFGTRGHCAKNSYIRKLDESVRMQGTFNGAFHPNYQGHRAVADAVWPKISKYFDEKLGGKSV